MSQDQSHVVVVGGSSGIGLATAQRLAASGMRVTITGRDPDRLEKARQTVPQVETFVMDAAAVGTHSGLFHQIGQFDHLVLALGSGKGFGPFATISLQNVIEGFEEKVYPHFAVSQAALPFLAKDGSITLISGVSANAAMPGTAGIGAANAAIATYVPILAAELAPLRVNGVSPGVIRTPWWSFMPAEEQEATFAQYAAKTPVGRVGEPDDIAQTIEFLIRNTFMTGQVVICDGGITLATVS